MPATRRQRSRKWPGKLIAFHVEAGAARDFHVDQRQRDRDAGAAIEHFVEEAVARIVVVRVVADEVLLRRTGTRSAPSTRANSVGVDVRRRSRAE